MSDQWIPSSLSSSNDYVSNLKHRLIQHETWCNRFELEGTFTANDLRLLADWLDAEQKTNIFEMKLSPLDATREKT